MEPDNLKEFGGLIPRSKPLFKSLYSLSYSRNYSHSEAEGSLSLHNSLPRVPNLSHIHAVNTLPTSYLLEQM